MSKRGAGWKKAEQRYRGAKIPEVKRTLWESFLQKQHTPEPEAMKAMKGCSPFRRDVIRFFGHGKRYRFVFMPEWVLKELGWLEEVEQFSDYSGPLRTCDAGQNETLMLFAEGTQ